jgi:hypothetical protein
MKFGINMSLQPTTIPNIYDLQNRRSFNLINNYSLKNMLGIIIDTDLSRLSANIFP